MSERLVPRVYPGCERGSYLGYTQGVKEALILGYTSGWCIPGCAQGVLASHGGYTGVYKECTSLPWWVYQGCTGCVCLPWWVYHGVYRVYMPPMVVYLRGNGVYASHGGIPQGVYHGGYPSCVLPQCVPWWVSLLCVHTTRFTVGLVLRPLPYHPFHCWASYQGSVHLPVSLLG